MPTYEQLEADIADAERLGDLERLDELLAQVSGLAPGDTQGDSPPPGENDPDAGDDGKEGQDGRGPGAADPAKAAGDTGSDRPVIRAKDGTNEIPYSVLEAEREAAAEARRQIAAMQAELDALRNSGQQTAGLQQDLDDLRAMNQLLVEQLKEAGLSPKTPPDRFELSEEARRELREEYGVVGTTIADLADAVAALRGRLTADVQRAPATGPDTPSQDQQPGGPSVQEIIQSDPDLSRWLQDPAAWAVAQHVDAQLANTPGYVGKPFSERRAEVVAITRQRLGEAPSPGDLAARADAIARQAPRVPASLTDVGGESKVTGKPVIEDLANASQVDIQAKLEALYERGGQKAVDAFLEQVLG